MAVISRPPSAVTEATGWVGAAGLLGTLALLWTWPVDLLGASVLLLLGTALPMVLWLLVVEKSHRRESAGLNRVSPLEGAELWEVVLLKWVGLASTFVVIALAYFTLPTYSDSRYAVYVSLAPLLVLFLLMASPLYLAWTTQRMVEPRDELWQFGKLVTGDLDAVNAEAIKNHLRSWAIKGFFLAFMVSVLPGLVAQVMTPSAISPVQWALWLIYLMYLFDVCFGTVGYMLTMRPLDAHIRTANPYLSAWVVALICYLPFVLMGPGGPLDYRSGTTVWHEWFAGHDLLLMLWAAMILLLTFVYAWATVIFGVRFSNLTHRGIITNGPYRLFKHPAYLSKNLAWWLVHIPFLSPERPEEALRSCLLLLLVNGVYFLRAKTEERHLMHDPVYREYSRWIAAHGLLARLSWRRRRVA